MRLPALTFLCLTAMAGSPAALAPSGDWIDLPEVAATASRTGVLAGDLPSPVVRFDAAEFDRAATSVLSEFLRNLPANGGGSFNEQYVVGTAPGTAAVSLRGLGPAHTLVLLNGRRLVPSGLAQEYTGSFVDVSALPLAVVRAVEIGKSGASAIHGSDAAAGVVNILTLDRLDQPQATFHYGQASHVDLGHRAIHAAAGFAGGPIRGVVAAGWSEQSGIRQGDRPFSASADQRPRGGLDKRSIAGPHPATLIQLQRPDQPLAVPAGPYSESDLRQNPDLGQNAFDYNQHLSLLPDQTRTFAYSSTSLQLGEAYRLVVELIASGARTRTFTPPPSTAMTGPLPVAAQHPYNPLRAPVLAFMRFPDGPEKHEITRTALLRALVGLEGLLPGDWTWRGGILPMRSRSVVTAHNEVRRDRLAAALQATDPALAYNPFGAWVDGPLGGADHNARIYPELLTETRRRGTSDMLLVDLGASGPIHPPVPGIDSLRLAVGAEAWDEQFRTREDPLAVAGLTLSPAGVGIDGSRTVMAGYAEALATVSAVDLQGAIRAERYSDFGSTVNPKLAALVRPLPGLRLRAGWGTGFRAPGLPQLFSGTLAYPQGLFDPVTQRDIRPTVVIGGNPNLAPEKSRSHFLGAEWSLRRPSGIDLAIGIDWTALHLDRVILADPQHILSNEAAFPGMVERDATGAVTRVHSPYQNLAARRVEAVDLQLLASRQGPGKHRVDARLQATWLYRWMDQAEPGGRWTDLAGHTNLAGRSHPQLRGQAALAWSGARWSAAATLHALSSYTALPRPADPAYRFKVDAWTSLDLQVGCALGQRTHLILGVRNLTDRQPPFADTSPGYDWAVHDPRGRMAFIQLKVQP